MMLWHGNGMSLWLLGMGVFWLLLIGLIVWLVVRLAAGRDRVPPAPGGPWPGAGPVPPAAMPPGAVGPGPVPPAGFVPPPWESPFEILDRRLAAGEIDVATYQQLRAALRESRGGEQ